MNYDSQEEYDADMNAAGQAEAEAKAAEAEAEAQYEEEVERLSAIFHDIYQNEAHRQEALGLGPARHYDEYEKLSEPVKEFDRVLARYVLQHFTRRNEA